MQPVFSETQKDAVDIFKKIQSNLGPLGKYSNQIHGYFTFPKLEGEIGPHMKFRGKEVLNWILNDYLGLANLPEVRQADIEVVTKWGLAYPMGSRVLSGQTNLHEQLESELAEFVGKENAYVLNAGYQGMISVITTLCSRHDVVVYDSEVHASVIDGVHLHIGKRFVYQHNNMESLEKQLKRAVAVADKQQGGVLVITEGVFAVSGELSQLDQITALKDKYDFRLLLNDAHGFGTMGVTGAGTAEHFDVQNKVDLYFAVFSNTMGTFGGFVAGKEQIINYLRYNMRSQIYSKSLPMTIVAGILKRFEILKARPELRKQLWKTTHTLQKELKASGFNIGNTNSMITPVFFSVGIPEATNMVMDLRENYSLFCAIISYPTIQKGQLLLQLTPTSSHTIEDIEYTIKALTSVRANLEAGQYRAEDSADNGNTD